jgi:spermidine synthase
MTALALSANGGQAVRADRRAGAHVLLACAAVPALIYQLAWQPALSGVFGGRIESAAVLTAAFMLAVGAGSLAGGWLSKRRAIPLLPSLAAVELMSSALGFASLQIFDSAGETAGSLALTVALALVMVSALPMGASVPLLVNDRVRRRGRAGGAFGLVVYVNFLGAGAGCLVGLVFMLAFAAPFVGAQGALSVAVASNAVIALGALVAHWRDRRGPTVTAGDAPAAGLLRQPMLRRVPLLSLAAAGGFVTWSYEIYFLHTLSYATGSSAIALAATASAFLLGLAMGARQASANCAARTRDGAMRRAVGVLMKGNLLGLLFLPLIAHLGWLDRGIIAAAVLMVYLVARCWGALLPYLAELGIAADGEAGMRTAILGLASCLGAAAGAILTGFVLIDGLGLVATGTVLVAAGLACALALVGALAMPRAEKILRVGLAAAFGLLVVVMTPRSSANVVERLQWTSASQAEPFAPVAQRVRIAPPEPPHPALLPNGEKE